ncbi:MAG: hypothetical protein ABWX92_17135 [Mycetocola sp.]
MKASNATSPTGNHDTVEAGIRRARAEFDRAGVIISPAKLSKTIRAAFRGRREIDAARMVRDYLALANPDEFSTWALTYADPTGRDAARNVDRIARTRARENRLHVETAEVLAGGLNFPHSTAMPPSKGA